MITKMLIEIFQAIVEDPQIKRLLGFYQEPSKQNTDIETLMNELGLDAKQKEKFRQAYKEYQTNPEQTSYRYKYEPKSNSPFDKFDAYYQKFEDRAKETGDYRHREYAKYRQQYGNQQQNYSQQNQQNKSQFNTQNTNTVEEKKHADALEIPIGLTDFEVIKNAYKKLMKKYHPDKFSDADKKKHAENLSMRINVAYDFFKKKFNK
jgi:DnaJ-domain-containing protein 1